MSAEARRSDDPTGGEVRYEVTATEDAVRLHIERGGRDVSVTTDSDSALLLAADILEAVRNASGGHPEGRTGSDVDG